MEPLPLRFGVVAGKGGAKGCLRGGQGYYGGLSM
jgi:hypothetical protein